MSRRLHQFLVDPIVIIVPIVLILFLGWNHYLYVTQHLNLPANNLMPQTAFEKFEKNGAPVGWQTSMQGDMVQKLSVVPGHTRDNALRVMIERYKQGDMVLASPIVNVGSHKTYLFKGYYSANMTFELLKKEYFQDSTSKISLVNTYSPTDRSVWSTVSDAFTYDPSVSAVQFVYRFSSNGTVLLNGNYLEPVNENSVRVATQTDPERNNILPNPLLTSDTTNTTPNEWEPYSVGDNRAYFSYYDTAMPRYLQVSTVGYKNGEAKWQHTPQSVGEGQSYSVGLDYQCTAKALLVVEYLMQDGQRQFHTIKTLLPAHDWTTIAETFETPRGATEMTITAKLQSNGTLRVRNQAVREITPPGPRYFNRPIVSITFDDGWESSFTDGAQYLDELDYKATFFINPLTLDTANFMTTAQVSELFKNHHEIASHGMRHSNMTTVDHRELTFQLYMAKKYMEDQFDTSEVNFAAPYGATDAQVASQVRKYYQSNRGTEDGPNTKQNFDPYNLRSFSVSKTTSPQAIQSAIDEAKQSNGWLILVYHQIKSSNQKQSISPDNFKKHVDAIQKSGLPIMTVQAALQELKQQ